VACGGRHDAGCRPSARSLPRADQLPFALAAMTSPAAGDPQPRLAARRPRARPGRAGRRRGLRHFACRDPGRAGRAGAEGVAARGVGRPGPPRQRTRLSAAAAALQARSPIDRGAYTRCDRRWQQLGDAAAAPPRRAPCLRELPVRTSRNEKTTRRTPIRTPATTNPRADRTSRPHSCGLQTATPGSIPGPPASPAPWNLRRHRRIRAIAYAVPDLPPEVHVEWGRGRQGTRLTRVCAAPPGRPPG
jgi:hypothetical protein